MPKKMPATIVKELRELTEPWIETDDIRKERVRGLIDQLPSFRSAPQTRNENTLRAVEAVLRANLNIDPTAKPVTETTHMRLNASDDLAMVTLLGIARIINVHHKVGQTKLTPAKQQLGEGPSDQDPPFHSIPDECNGFYDSTYVLVHQFDCPVHGVAPQPMTEPVAQMVADQIAKKAEAAHIAAVLEKTKAAMEEAHATQKNFIVGKDVVDLLKKAVADPTTEEVPF